MEVSSKIGIGKRVIYKGDMANEPGKGAVVNIRRNGSAGQMYSLNFGSGRLEQFDSSVSFDIALDDGRLFPGVYVSNIGGEFSNKSCRFMLADGIADAAELAALEACVALKIASDKAIADEQRAAKVANMAAAKVAGLALGLIPEADFAKSGKRGSAAAWNLRAEIKAAGIKARVVNDGYSALRVMVKAGDVGKVKDIAYKYEAGKFDAMSDCYNFAPGAWGEVFGDVRYVFVYSEGS